MIPHAHCQTMQSFVGLSFGLLLGRDGWQALHGECRQAMHLRTVLKYSDILWYLVTSYGYLWLLWPCHGWQSVNLSVSRLLGCYLCSHWLVVLLRLIAGFQLEIRSPTAKFWKGQLCSHFMFLKFLHDLVPASTTWPQESCCWALLNCVCSPANSKRSLRSRHLDVFSTSGNL